MNLPFEIKSIEVVNTGFGDEDVEGVLWIDEKKIQITNAVDCCSDDLGGGTSVMRTTEFDWSFVKLDRLDAYVLITIKH